MAKITFKKGEMFTYKDGVGIVVSKRLAVTIDGFGVGLGYSIKTGQIPSDAVPAADDDNNGMTYEKLLALRTAKAVLR